jgi:hypothetical protein
VFIQVIQGKTHDVDGLHGRMDVWRDELSAGADGWLGGTYGIDDDNEFIGIVRFDSRESAMRNSDRPEQGAWWAETEKCFDGDVAFHDCDDVTLMLDGGSDDAGFVQVIRGKVDDPAKLKSLMGDTDMLHELRPEILGATLAIEADGTFTETVAFTDEESARAGESKEMPEMPADVRDTLETAMQGATYYDLHHPWFASQ